MFSFFVFWLLGFPILLFSQNNLLNRADNYYQAHAFSEAIPLYQKYLRNNMDIDAKEKLAECYSHLRDFTQAAKLYHDLVSSPETKPLNLFLYGRTLMALEQYNEARKWFAEYQKSVPSNKLAADFVQFCDSVPAFKLKKSTYLISRLSINSKQSDFSPMYYRDKLVFSSSRQSKKSSGTPCFWDACSKVDMFFTTVSEKEKKLAEPSLLKGENKTGFQDGASCYDISNNLIWFTRYLVDPQVDAKDQKKSQSSKNDPLRLNLKLFYVSPSSRDWREGKPFSFNSDHYSVGHPTLSSDGKELYFVSDQPGGYGGTDIYVSYRLADTLWTQPLNLGPEINTPFNEIYPFFHSSGSLFFSSDGHPGFGGMDIFVARRHGVWGHVENLGYPINSSADDFGFILDFGGEEGCFASNRKGGEGASDLYQVHLATRLPECPLQLPNSYCFTFLEKGTDFDNSKAAERTNYHWDFGDGQSAVGTEVEHCYAEPGSYLVILSEEGILSKQTLQTVKTYTLVLEDFKQVFIESPDTVYVNEEVVLDASRSRIKDCSAEDFQWDF